jgi:hypothetical protein
VAARDSEVSSSNSAKIVVAHTNKAELADHPIFVVILVTLKGSQ